MTLSEILAREPYLTTTPDGRIVVLPAGRRGFTSYPVTETKLVKSSATGEVKQSDYQTVTVAGAVSISAAEYELLSSGGGMWSGSRVVPYVPTAAEKQLSEAEAKRAEIKKRYHDAESELEKYDYVGRKISEAFLMNDTDALAAMQEQYAGVFEEAKVHRATVSECRAALEKLDAEIKRLQEVVNNENT